MELLADGLIIDKGIDCEVEVKTADIHIGGAYAADLGIGHHHLAVHKALLIYITAHSCLEQNPDVGKRGPPDEGVVSPAGYYYPHIDTGKGGDAQGVKNTVVGDK